MDENRENIPPRDNRKRKSDDSDVENCTPPKRSTRIHFSSERNGIHKHSLDSSQSRRRLEIEYKKKELGKAMYKEYGHQIEEINLKPRHNEIRDMLSAIIRRRLYHSAHVYIVGSLVSGVGIVSSGLDLMVLFEKMREGSELTIIRNIRSIIRNLELVEDIEIKDAETDNPYLIFVDRDTRTTVNIKVNQKKRILSTILVKSYTRIDDRVAPLIFVVKSWAKSAEIPLDKLLNGYTISLMAIHFLQSGCRPAVLPESETFMNDISEDLDFGSHKLYIKLPDFRSRNRQSVGQLLHNLLEYYGHRFAFNEKVISVRTTSPILKSTYLPNMESIQKNPLYVEEPFDLSNTATEVDSDIAMETIHKAFRGSLHKLALNGDLKSLF